MIKRSICPTILAVLLAAGLADAAAAQECGDFTLTASEKTTTLLDHGEEGSSTGDGRVLERQLNDASGENVGVVYMVSTLVKAGSDGKHLFAASFDFVLRDGQLFGRSLYERPNDTVPYTEPVTVNALGGSGAYRGAVGTVEIGQGDYPDYVFALSCG